MSFYDHIKGAHFLWNYVFYIYFLNAKSPTEYSGLESQITSQYNGKTEEDMVIDWVPTNEEVEFDVKGKLEELNLAIDEKFAKMEETSGEVATIVKEFKDIAGELAA